MGEKHYKSMLSAFVARELGQSEQEEIGRHLMLCSACRAEHDQIKLGSLLAAFATRGHDAAPGVWHRIEAGLGRKSPSEMSVGIAPSYFVRKNLFAAAIGCVALIAVCFIGFLTLNRERHNDQVQNHAPVEVPVVVTVPPDSSIASAATPQTSDPVIAAPASPVITTDGGAAPREVAPTEAAWGFETLAGRPSGVANAKRIAVGEVLETDAASRARISVADIGNVEIAPNSRVRMVGSSAKQHRLSLERGSMHARIAAPPRLFIVDTPSAVAVDLGCEYTLDVDKHGNSTLKVLSGFVALELADRESIVPAGVMCVTVKGKGLGTPYATDTDKEFRVALTRFDFAGGGSDAVRTMLDKRGFYDMITLWHLLSRVNAGDRSAVFDALADYVKPPKGVTRDGVLRLDRAMLDEWRQAVETAWFE